MFATVTQWCRRGYWVAEIALLGSIYVFYEVVRASTSGGIGGPYANGRHLFRYEQMLHLDPEHALNRLFTHVPALAIPSCYIYAVCHYVVTPIVLVWLWRAHKPYYMRTRSILIVGTMIGLVGFWELPMAPPRLIGAGFTDTMAQWQQIGWWSGAASAPRGLAHLTDQFGAMPSLHVGWSVWCGYALARHAKHLTVRILGAAYPVIVTFVVMGTANHYFADAVAGLAVMAVAFGMVYAIRWLWARFISAELIRTTMLPPVGAPRSSDRSSH